MVGKIRPSKIEAEDKLCNEFSPLLNKGVI